MKISIFTFVCCGNLLKKILILRSGPGVALKVLHYVKFSVKISMAAKICARKFTYDPNSTLSPLGTPNVVLAIGTRDVVPDIKDSSFLRSGGSLMATEIALFSMTKPSVFTSACAAEV